MHVHIFPHAIAERAVNAIGAFYENFNMESDGTLESALREMDAAGIAQCCAHSVATTAHQVDPINDFVMDAHQRHPDRIVPFAAMHPKLRHPVQTAEDILDRGFKGIKVHPEIQGFNIDDSAVMDMLAPFEGKIPILIHCGDYRYDNSCPDRIKRVRRAFPRMKLVCAHLGGWQVWRENARQLIGEDVYVDTSSALFALRPGEAEAIIRGYGVERALYGTDFPMWSPVTEIERFNRLDLTEDEREKILWSNHFALFGSCEPHKANP